MFVDAIERENWRVIGEAVYARGFVRNYARLVGLDPAPMLEQLNRQYPLPKPATESFAPATEPRKRRVSWLLASMSAVAAILVAMVVWNIVMLGRQPPQGASTAQPSAASESGLPGAGEMAGANASPVVPKSGVDLRLQITQNSWLSVRVDGKRVLYETLPAGSVREFHGVKEITLRAGNAGGVVATIDGQELGRLGGPGEVSDRIFAAKSMVNPGGPRE